MTVARVYMKVATFIRRVLRHIRPSPPSEPFALIGRPLSRELDQVHLNTFESCQQVPIYQSSDSFGRSMILHGSPVLMWSMSFLYAASQFSIKTMYAASFLGTIGQVFSKQLSHRYFFIHRMSLAQTGTIILLDIGQITGRRFISAANIDQVVFHSPPQITNELGRFHLSAPVTITVKSMWSAFGRFSDVKLSLPQGGEVMVPELLRDVAEQREVDMETGARIETREKARQTLPGQ